MPDNLRVDIAGLEKTYEALRVWRHRSEGAFQGAVFMLATNVISTALKLTPADTGYLRASRYVRRPVVTGTRFEVEVGFGAPYAIHVHEINKHYVVGEWKFLATAVSYHAQTALADLASWTAKLAAAGMTIEDVPETHPRIWTGGERVVPKRSGRFRAKRRAEAARNPANVPHPLTPAQAAARDARGARRPGR